MPAQRNMTRLQRRNGSPNKKNCKGLENFQSLVGPAVDMQAGTKGKSTHSSGISSRFASLHDVLMGVKMLSAGDTKST